MLETLSSLSESLVKLDAISGTSVTIPFACTKKKSKEEYSGNFYRSYISVYKLVFTSGLSSLIIFSCRKFTLLTLPDCWRRCLSRYLGFTWMLFGGRWDCRSARPVLLAAAEPSLLALKPSSFSICWSVFGWKTPFQVPKRCRILERIGGSTCL